MKRLIWVLLGLVVLAGMPFNVVPVQASVQAEPAAQQEPPVEPFTGQVLCLPDAYPTAPEDCLPMGPSTVLTDLAQKGMTFPAQPLPVTRPDPALNQVNVKYARINSEDPTPMYPSLDAAISGEGASRFLPGGNGLRYVVYQNTADVDGGHYVQIESGEWMRASPAITSSTFQGVLLNRVPHSSFGWIFSAREDNPPRVAPGYQSAPAGRVILKEELVPIYDMVEEDGTKWYMIDLNVWVDRNTIRQMTIASQPPEGVTNNRWIEVNLEEQTLAAYDNGSIVFATMIATGVEPYYTRPGLFQIYQKKELETMQGAFEAGKGDFYYLDGVPWTMYFDKARALHGAYWRAWFGVEQSHGCVNLSLGDSQWLYNWAKEGDWVYVHDPSGKTPTDPNFYGDGGA